MSYFISKHLKKFAQQTSDAICSVLHMQVTIVDASIRRIGGTGWFSLTLDEILSPSFLFNEVIRTGEKCFIENPRQTEYCKDCLEKENCMEKATLLIPVKLDDQVIGGIGLAAMTDGDKEILLENVDHYTEFMEHMADLLAAKVKSELYITQLSLYAKKFETVVSAFSDGILSTDADGRLTHFNRPAELILKKGLDVYIGKEVTTFLHCPLFENALKAASSVEDQRSAITVDGTVFSVVISIKTIVCENKIEGFVAFFQELVSSKKKYESMFLSDARYTFDNILGNSKEIQQCIEMAKKVSKSNSSVLILGESGTGKELFARAIHNTSHRAKNNFIAINCSAIPDALLESELFGYEGGSFTGAKKEGSPGKFEIANGGTIFLDEIGDMPLNLQAKLLRVLQDRVVERIGNAKPLPIDVRIIAATNKDLDSLVSQNLFRSDLYYRIHVIPIHIPPFRERKGDVKVVAEYLLKKHNHLLGKDITSLAPEVLNILEDCSWPGNVRELENVIEYAANMETSRTISVDSLPMYLLDPKNSQNTRLAATVEFPEFPEEAPSLKTFSNQTERNQIINALSMFEDSTSGKKECAKYLKISLSTLYRKLNEYKID